MPRRRKTLPLDGIFVADFSRVLAGPLCTQMLADAGADVVKIEEPRFGDETRRWGPPFAGGVATYFLSVNRNKRSLALDLELGTAVTRALIERADVVVDNFLPHQRVAFGLDRVQAINPRAIHCTISGFDADTPEGSSPGYDLLAQAGAGLMSITGDPAGDPMKIGVALSDVLTAHYAFGAICTALFSRERTGRGTRVEVSLFAATLASLVNIAQGALVTGREARRMGNEHPSIVPYQLFHASDRPFAIGAGTDRHYRALCEDVLGRPDLAADERFLTNHSRVTNRRVLVPLLESLFATKTARTWVARCRKASIPVSLVRGVREALSTPEAAPLIAPVVHPLAGPYQTVTSPLRIGGERYGAGSPPPALGEHTGAVLRELGFDAQTVASMRRAKITGPRTTTAEGRGSRRG